MTDNNNSVDLMAIGKNWGVILTNVLAGNAKLESNNQALMQEVQRLIEENSRLKAELEQARDELEEKTKQFKRVTG